MDIELNFLKSDNEVWGFRLTGGAEYDVPFVVLHVADGSIADKGGLKINDVIVNVNGISTIELTHNETHNLLLTAGNSLKLVIRRDETDLISPLTYDDDTNEEVSNIMQPYLDNDENFEHERQVHFEIIDPTAEKYFEEKSPMLSEGQKDISLKNVVHQNGFSTNERKWSSFLQKPTNPKPSPKKNEEHPKVEPYRVVIIKQKKKTLEERKNKTPLQNVKSSEHISEDEENGDINQDNSKTPDNTQIEETVLTDEEIKEESEAEGQEDIEKSETQSSEENNVEEQDPQLALNETQIEKDDVLERFLEEKLTEVQKQLEELSKLPSTIQSTIDSLNKQLASIVKITPTEAAKNEEKELSDNNSESEDDVAEQTVTEEEERDAEKEVHQSEERIEDVELPFDEKSETQETLDVEEENVMEEDSKKEQELTEEQQEAIRQEQELLEKQEKERELIEEFKQRRLKQKPTLPLKPIERPIILPGGRRWSQPDDACPVARHTKMSDEKIANTIETYSEVIVGKTKGINFLKYQPPPKNLDYLHRSDVYKLVHDLEPPVRGISNRTSKILAEQDYYQAE
ncbi:golgin subfamily A member 6-like protein 22 isoform X2 [Zophobas morio]|uniref:golgin subfamily A member 6-like protein 22 isoform X2 n=1 Tax=Zophobas morio TaxID=2755281 RepID=UPI003083D97E